MAKSNSNSLESFMITREAQEYFFSLSVADRKRFEGLENFDLAAAIEEEYQSSKRKAFYATLPATDRRKLDKLSDNEREAMLGNLMHKATQQTYDAERQIAETTYQHYVKKAKPQQQELFSAVSNDMARRSFFFIEGPDGIKREQLDGMVMGAGSWGFVSITGKKLYTSDEKHWLVLLGLAIEQQFKRIADWHVIQGSIRSFLRRAKLPETGHYTTRFIESIRAMHGSSFNYESSGETGNQTGKTKKKKLKDKLGGWHLINNFTIDAETDHFIIILDRGFIETFIGKFYMYTSIDVAKFCRQPPVAAALHRSFIGHTPGKDGLLRINLLLVAKTINMLNEYPPNIDSWPNAELKRSRKKLIVAALKHLVKDGTFGPRTGIMSRGRGEDDLVLFDIPPLIKGKSKNKQLPKN